jgi:hypothetical protein
LRTSLLHDGSNTGQVCAVGVVIAFTGALELGFGKQNWDSMKISPWIWALNLFHIVGLGTTKLSVAFYLLRIFERRYCSYSIYAMIGRLFTSSELIACSHAPGLLVLDTCSVCPYCSSMGSFAWLRGSVHVNEYIQEPCPGEPR